MKFTASKKELIRALESASSIADKKSAVPILANALLTVADGKLSVSAQDLYLFVRSTLPVDKSADGSVCMAARDLLDRVRAVPGDSVTMSLKEDDVSITGAKGTARKFTQSCLPGDTFPALPFDMPPESSIKIPASSVRLLLSQVLHAVSLDATRLALNAVLISSDGDSSLAVSTDGHRLAKAELFGAEGTLPQVLLSLKGAAQLNKECASFGDERVTISLNGATLLFSADGYSFAAKTVDATFPPYDQVVPKSLANNAEINRVALIESLKSIALAADEKSGNVSLVFEKGKLTVEAQSHSRGAGVDTIECDYSGKRLSFGVNSRYMVEALNAFPDQEVVIVYFDGERDPVVIREKSPADCGSSIQLVMPATI